MERRMINTLIVNDDDLDCDCKETTLENLSIANVGFRLPDIERFDMVIYKGKRGEKILRSKYTKLGKIE
jgi:hypothetical protein